MTFGVVSFIVRNSKTISQIKPHTYIIHILLEKMDGDSANCCRPYGLRHDQREAQHGGGGGGNDGAIPHPNLTLAYETI